jgi:hypothetical protein
MAYIGKQPLVGNYISCDSLSASATTTYNLVSSGTPVFPTVPQNCIVSLNGVVQAPVTSFTISGSAIVFSTALSTTDSIDYITVLGNTLNIGTPSNNTVGLSQLSATGTPSATTFLRGDNSWATPGADLVWQSVQTTSFTAVAGRAYPINTTSAGITVTLPATPAAGNQVQIVDYAGTADTNPITINPNSNKIESGTANLALTGDREGVILTYIDATQGWLATSGINEGTDALSPLPYSIDFLVIAGGASGGFGNYGGGGGAGGYRTSTQTVNVGTVITVTVGDGGAYLTGSGRGNDGSSSSISGSGLTTITSAGGGGGGGSPNATGVSGGSGGGGAGIGNGTGGSGNTPSTSPSQGNNGGNGTNNDRAGGGGGAGEAGSTDGTSQGGDGTASSITGSSVTRAGGGGGNNAGSGSAGGDGGGGTSTSDGGDGTANTGGGGGSHIGGSRNGAGGKGVVILSVPTASYSSTTTGSPTVTTSGSNTILQFNGSGSYTA